MENRQAEQISPEQQTSEVFSRRQYMSLVKARQSSDSPEVIPSYEIIRQNVTIEKIIGKGAFGQVAKGKVKGLRGKQHVKQVAIKMLKGKILIDHSNQLTI